MAFRNAAFHDGALASVLLGVRAVILARYAPLLLLLYAVGAADGFTQRVIRLACGGRESAGFYQRAKYLRVAVLGLGGVGLLLWPGPVRWEPCAPIGAVLAGGLAGVQWTYYKKHMQVRSLVDRRLRQLSTKQAFVPISLLVNSRRERDGSGRLRLLASSSPKASSTRSNAR